MTRVRRTVRWWLPVPVAAVLGTHHTEATSQEKAYTARGNESGRIVQCWKPCDPEPEWLFVDGMKHATWAGLSGRICGVTTVGQMRDRRDLDQWEYADNDPQSVGWTVWSDMGWDGTPDDLPVIVRRRR